MANTDNMSGGDQVSTTWLSGTIVGYGNAASGGDGRNKVDAGREAQQATDEVNRIAGGTTKISAPTDTAHAASAGGSIVPQVNVGAKQW